MGFFGDLCIATRPGQSVTRWARPGEATDCGRDLFETSTIRPVALDCLRSTFQVRSVVEKGLSRERPRLEIDGQLELTLTRQKRASVMQWQTLLEGAHVVTQELVRSWLREGMVSHVQAPQSHPKSVPYQVPDDMPVLFTPLHRRFHLGTYLHYSRLKMFSLLQG